MTTAPTARLDAASSRRGFQLLCLAGFAEFFGVGVTIPALPRFISHDLGRGDLAVGLGVGVFAIGALAVRPFAGNWGDLHGRRPLVILGLLLTAVSTALTGIGHSFLALLGLRIVAGVGQAIFFVGAATLVADLAPPGRRGASLSMFSLPTYVGLGLGPALGEHLYRGSGARTAFLVAGALPALGLLLARVLPEQLPTRASPAVTAKRTPSIHRAALGPGAVLLMGLLGFIAFQAYLPLYADTIGLAHPELVFLLYTVTVILVRSIGASIPDRLGPAPTGTLAGTAIFFGLLVVAVVPVPVGVYIGATILGIGMALQYPAMMSLAIGRAPESERARVISTFSGFFDLAQAGGGAVLGGMAAAFGYRAAFAGGAVSALLAVLLLQVRVAAPRRVAQVRNEPDSWAPPGAE